MQKANEQPTLSSLDPAATFRIMSMREQAEARVGDRVQLVDGKKFESVPEPLMKIIREKFKSGNDIEVERITLTRAEFESQT